MSVCLKNTQMSMENACPLEEEKKKQKTLKTYLWKNWANFNRSCNENKLWFLN